MYATYSNALDFPQSIPLHHFVDSLKAALDSSPITFRLMPLMLILPSHSALSCVEIDEDCPKMSSAEMGESADDGAKVFRSAGESRDVQHPVFPPNDAAQCFNINAFRDLIGPLWNAEQKAAFTRSFAYLKEWLIDLLKGLEAFVLHRYRAADWMKINSISVSIDEGLVREYLAMRRVGNSNRVEPLPVLDRSVYLHPSYSPDIPPLTNHQLAGFQIALHRRGEMDAPIGYGRRRTGKQRSERTSFRDAVVSQVVLGREKTHTRASVAGRDEEIPIGRPFDSSETQTTSTSIPEQQARDESDPSVLLQQRPFAFYDYGNDEDGTLPTDLSMDSPPQSALASPASIVFEAPASPLDEHSIFIVDPEEEEEIKVPSEEPLDIPSITRDDSSKSRDIPTTHDDGGAETTSNDTATKKRRRSLVKKLAPGKRHRNAEDPDDDVSDVDDLDEVYAKSFSFKSERSNRQKKRKEADDDDDD